MSIFIYTYLQFSFNTTLDTDLININSTSSIIKSGDNSSTLLNTHNDTNHKTMYKRDKYTSESQLNFQHKTNNYLKPQKSFYRRVLHLSSIKNDNKRYSTASLYADTEVKRPMSCSSETLGRTLSVQSIGKSYKNMADKVTMFFQKGVKQKENNSKGENQNDISDSLKTKNSSNNKNFKSNNKANQGTKENSLKDYAIKSKSIALMDKTDTNTNKVNSEDSNTTIKVDSATVNEHKNMPTIKPQLLNISKHVNIKNTLSTSNNPVNSDSNEKEIYYDAEVQISSDENDLTSLHSTTHTSLPECNNSDLEVEDLSYIINRHTILDHILYRKNLIVNALNEITQNTEYTDTELSKIHLDLITAYLMIDKYTNSKNQMIEPIYENMHFINHHYEYYKLQSNRWTKKPIQVTEL